MRQEGASGNTDVSRDLVPLLASTSTTLERVFPEDQISEVSMIGVNTLYSVTSLIRTLLAGRG